MCVVSIAIKCSSLDDSIKKKVIPKNAIMPLIHDAPKIHKDNVLSRPVTNTIGSSTYCLEKYLTKKLTPSLVMQIPL